MAAPLLRTISVVAVLSLAPACAMEVAGEDEELLEDGIETPDPDDEVQAATSCAGDREEHCHESANNCSVPRARPCDPLPRALDRVSRTMWFPVAGTGHALDDSRGHRIATVTDAEVRLNFGQRRVIDGNRKVFAWAAGTDAGARSGWINESAIARDLSWMPSVTGRRPGGSYSTWRVVASNNAPYLDATGASLKVVRTCGSGRNATDYLARNGRANLIFNLPGYQPAIGSPSIDTYQNDAGIHFMRAKAQLSISRPLWSCATGSPVKVSRRLSFLYGYVVGAEERHGWMAMPNLRPGE
jgi:hypothetical protein